MGVRISRLQVWHRSCRGSRWTMKTTTPGTRTGSCSFFSNMHVIHVYLPIFKWESEFWGDKGDKSHVEGPGEQWERQPQEPGQGIVQYACDTSCPPPTLFYPPPQIAYLKKWTTGVAILIVHLDPWNGFCHPCYLKIWIHVWKNLDSCLKKWTTSCCGPFGCRSQCSPWPSTWHLSHLKTRNSDSDWKIGI